MRRRAAHRHPWAAKRRTWTPPTATIEGTRPGRAALRNGFTLVELIIALALFALIGVAGFSMLSGVLQTQESTDGRLRRLSEIQRAMFVVAADFDQVSGRIEGDQSEVTFQKVDLAGRSAVVKYDLLNGQLMRTVSGPFGERVQPLLTGVDAMTWSYRQSEPGWRNEVAAPAVDVAAALSPPAQPMPVSAVAVDFRLVGVDGRQVTLRRVFRTPESGA